MEGQNCPRRNNRRAALFGINVSRPLLDVTLKRAEPHTVVEGILSRFFHSSAGAEAIIAGLPGPLWKSNQKGVAHLMQAAR